MPPEDEPYSNSDIDTRKITVTFIKDETGAEMRRVDMTLPQLAEHIRFQTAASKMALPWLKLALFGNKRSEKNSLRTNENVLQITGIEVEHDAGEIAFDDCACNHPQGRNPLHPLHVASPTFPATRSAGASWCRCRRTIRRRCGRSASRASTACSAASSRGESFVLSQAYLYGSVNNNPDHRVEVIDGKFLDLRDDLYAGSIFKDGSRVGGNGTAQAST